MNLQEIKAAVAAGRTVHWSSESYRVVYVGGVHDRWLISCRGNDYRIGLTRSDGVTLNGREEDFYVAKTETERLREAIADDIVSREVSVATHGTSLLVSLDGGKTYAEATEGVRVIHATAFRVGDNEPVALHINLTNEGMILDLWSESANVGTECRMFDDIVNEFLDAI